jgi:hypothetical protein
MTNRIERRVLLAIVVGLAAATSAVRAAEKNAEPAAKAAKADPSGTWTWTFNTPSGQSFEPKLTLKLQGDKLTGSMSGRGGQERPIEDASFKAGDVSFKVVRERNGEKFTTEYSGKLSGDVIKGTMKGRFGGEDRTTPWEAKRVK